MNNILKRNAIKHLIILIVLCNLILFKNSIYAQQFVQIESILVDACNGTQEGENEMLLFNIETVDINVADIRVDGALNGGAYQTNKWPNTSNSFLGWIVPGTTAWNNAVTKVSQINASIVNCGILIMPTGGTSNLGLIPAEKKGIIISSTDFSPFANDFSTLSDTLYIIFQKPGNTSGHFANYSSGTGLRSLRLHQNSTGTNETVTYDKVLLINQAGNHVAQDGAGVRYTDAGVATYYNDGCQAPYIPLNSDWTPPAPLCESAAALNLNSLLDANATTGGTWTGSGVSGNNFNPAGLSGNISITYTAGTAPCQSSEAHNIQVVSSANASWTAPAPICQSATALDLTTLLTATATTGGTWSGSGVTGNNFNPAGLSGNISITYTAGTAPCQSSEAHNIQVVPSANASWTAPAPICQSATALDLTTLLTATSTTGGTWSGSGVTGNNFNPAGLSGNISITYKVGILACVDSLTHIINVIPSANASWNSTSIICKTQSQFDLNTLITGTQGGIWAGNGVTSHFINLAEIGDNITLTYSISNNGCNAESTATLHFSSVEANFDVNNLTGIAPLTVNVTNLSQNANTYFWDFGNGFNSIDENPTIQYNEEGEYNIWLIAKSEAGCIDSTYKTIIVNEFPDFIPNVFSPNGDNINDEFYPIITKIIENYQMLIFNRWGEMIFETTELNKHWDGKIQDQDIPEGVYFYTIAYSYQSKLYKFNGSITLIR